MDPIRILALHGFLGLPSDWNQIKSEAEKDRDVIWISYDINHAIEKYPTATNFEALAEKIYNELFTHYPHIDLICGYSFGGRLGLHLLELSPKFFDKLMMISAQLGLPEHSIAERQARLANDLKWAIRFENEDFASVLKDWNKQEIFKYSFETPRNESDYSKSTLGSLLKNFSLGSQRDFTPWIKQRPHLLYWLFGERDTKYKQIAGDLVGLNTIEVKSAGHRVIFDQPEFIVQQIKHLQKIKKVTS